MKVEIREDVFDIYYVGFNAWMHAQGFPCPSKEAIAKWVEFCAIVTNKAMNKEKK